MKNIDLSSDIIDTYYWLSDSYYNIGKYDKVINNSLKIDNLKVDDDNIKYLSILGKSYYKSENYKKAASVLSKVLEKDEDNLEILTLLGKSYSAINNHKKAIEMFVKYDSLNHNDTDNLKSLSKLYYDNEEYNNSINVFLKLTESHPDEPEYWYYLGNSLKNTNQYKEAKESYKKALKINPYNQTYKEGLKSVGSNFLKSASSLVTIFFILVLIVCGIFLFKAKANLGMALPLFTVIIILMFKTISLLKK